MSTSSLAVAANTAPGVSLRKVDQAAAAVSAVRTDVAAFVGIAERGPVDTAVAVESRERFEALFGGPIAAGFLACAVRAFFENGGARCRVVRVASGSAATATAALPGLDGRPTLRVEATGPGTWGNGLRVRVGQSSPGSSQPDPAAIQPADLGSSLLRSVAGFTRGGLVRVYQEGGAGAITAYRVIAAVDAALRQVVWDRPLEPPFDPTAPATFEVVEFSLGVEEDGLAREVFEGLSMLPEHPRYVLHALAERPSALVRVRVVEDADGGRSLPGRFPAPAGVDLEGGCDGLADLAPADFTGDMAAERPRGLRCLESIDEVSIVAVPDALIGPAPPPVLHEPPPPPPPPPDPCLAAPATAAVQAIVSTAPVTCDQAPPALSLDGAFAIQRALVAHCEARGDRIALLEAPDRQVRGRPLDVAEIEQWRRRFDSKYAAFYHPWLLVDDALVPGGGAVRAIPPSGHVAGLYAATDLSLGVHHAPANVELRWARDVSSTLDAGVQATLNPLGVNCIRAFPGRGIRVFGARTVSSDPDWRFVNVRRLLMMIEVAVRDAVQWAVFEPHDRYLRETVKIAIGSFLTAVWQRGALVGGTAAEAFYVKCDASDNPPGETALGRLVAEVGVAAVRPAEFVLFTLVQVEDALEAQE